MLKVLEAEFMKEAIAVIERMYLMGWDERNGGNLTYLLDESEVFSINNQLNKKEHIPVNFKISGLEGRTILVTGSGIYFRNIKQYPEKGLGIVRICEDGLGYDVLWGFTEGALPTSELPAHLLSHWARLQVDPLQKVVIHTHATHLLAMTYTQDLNSDTFTHLLWKMCTECIVVFPEGVEIIPWEVPGTTKIGEMTATAIQNARLVIWPFHGIYGCGSTLDETFGLIETAEKAAEVFTITQAQGGIKHDISDEQLHALARRFNVIIRPGILK